jgi:hypothetical protein
MAGHSKAEIVSALKAAFDNKQLPDLENGAMAFMINTERHRRSGNWRKNAVIKVSIEIILRCSPKVTQLCSLEMTQVGNKIWN